jgi:putative heme degradation protein
MSDVLESIPQMNEEELIKSLVLAIKYGVDTQRLAIVARAIIEELERRGYTLAAVKPTVTVTEKEATSKTKSKSK